MPRRRSSRLQAGCLSAGFPRKKRSGSNTLSRLSSSALAGWKLLQFVGHLQVPTAALADCRDRLRPVAAHRCKVPRQHEFVAASLFEAAHRRDDAANLRSRAGDVADSLDEGLGPLYRDHHRLSGGGDDIVRPARSDEKLAGGGARRVHIAVPVDLAGADGPHAGVGAAAAVQAERLENVREHGAGRQVAITGQERVARPGIEPVHAGLGEQGEFHSSPRNRCAASQHMSEACPAPASTAR